MHAVVNAGDEDDWEMDETGDVASDDGMEGVDKLPPDHSDTMDHGDTYQVVMWPLCILVHELEHNTTHRVFEIVFEMTH